MSAQSPAVVLYDSNGVALQVYNNTAVPASTPAILVAGFDGYNSVSRYAMMGALGNLGVSDTSNNVSIFNNGTITASGNDIFSAQFFGTQQINLIINVTAAPTGTTPTLTFTIQEVDPGDATTVFGSTASTTAINGTGVFTAVLTTTHSSAVKVSWVITGAGASFTGVYVSLTTKNTPDTQVISGSITATNNSVGADGAAFLGFDTQVGGKTTTSAPTYVNGNLDALSLTTLGGLRIDGVYATGTANATAADAIVSGGYVTTAAPTYTTGQLNALSLTTAGALRVDGSAVTQPVSGTVTANQGTSPWVTSVSGTVAVTQSTSPWVVSGTGGTFDNRSVGTDAATALGFDTQVGGIVSTAAPTYTNGNLDALSLTTAGALRVDASGTTISVTANKASTSSITSVASSASNVTLLSANANRIFASIYNDSSKQVFIKLGTTASNSSFSILLMPNSYWEVPSDYTGRIDAIWSSANGNARVTELSP